MGFRQFTTREYERLRTQHNVMALVGNGFDIQVTRGHGTRFSPRYTAFYHYLHARDFDSTNVIVRQMELLKDEGRTDWSELEGAIASLLAPSGSVGTEAIYEATVAIQEAFSEYLELVAPPDLLAALGKESSSGSLAIRSMSDFIGDVARSTSFEKLGFPTRTDHYDLFNFCSSTSTTRRCWTTTSTGTRGNGSPASSRGLTGTSSSIPTPPITPEVMATRPQGGRAT